MVTRGGPRRGRRSGHGAWPIARVTPPLPRTGSPPLPVLPGTVATGVILSLTLLPIAALWLRAEAPAALSLHDLSALRFTLLQAGLSTLLSCLLAIPVARALARRSFPGRTLLLTLLGAPFILPVIVAVLGLIVVFGRAGWANQMLGAIGLSPVSVYGLQGVVLAHVFFNLPLATRLILQGQRMIPAEHFRLAAQLGLGSGAVLRHLEAPMLRRVLPGAAATIFLLCVASFAVVLALGGGPGATTLELAIYQAFRFDFDLGRAAFLGLAQLALCAMVAAAALGLGRGAPSVHGGLDRMPARWDGASALSRVGDALWILLAAGFLILPLVAVALRGAEGLAELPAALWPALARSLGVSLAATAIALGLSLGMCVGTLALQARRPRLAGWMEGAGYLPVAASPMVMGTGLYVILFPLADPFSVALPLTALVNATLALPFMLRALLPAMREDAGRFGALAASLDMGAGAMLRLVLLPRLRGPLGFSAGLCAALSMGDLGVIALFGRPGAETVPLLLYDLIGAYRMQAASGVALVLLLAALALFRAFDWLGER